MLLRAFARLAGIRQGKDIKTRLPERISGDTKARLLLEGNIKKSSV
jgi:hypothetical protein